MGLPRIYGAVATGGVCTNGPVRYQGFVGGCDCFSSSGLNILHYVYSLAQGEDDADEVGPVQLTSSRVRLGQSLKTVGYGCSSCWGDVGAGDVEADVFYIPFIVSVQYIVY